MPEPETGFLDKIEEGLGLSRPPFHTLGILPFCLGTFLAWRIGHVFRPTALILGMLGIVMVMLSTYAASGHFALVQNERSRQRFRDAFAWRSGSLADWLLHRFTPIQTSILFMALAVFIGCVMQFGLKTGPWTLLLGFVGALPGFFYATRPIHPAASGLGELLIAFCYGWLPIVAAFYIQRGYIAPVLHWMALPIGLSIFNVALLHEFPGDTVHRVAGDGGLLDRLGKEKGTALYCMTSVLSWFSMYSSLNAGIPPKALYIYLPVMILSAGITLMMAGKRYGNPLVLEILYGLNFAVHLGTTAAFFLAFL